MLGSAGASVAIFVVWVLLSDEIVGELVEELGLLVEVVLDGLSGDGSTCMKVSPVLGCQSSM